jgi:hypothetical protein
MRLASACASAGGIAGPWRIVAGFARCGNESVRRAIGHAYIRRRPMVYVQRHYNTTWITPAGMKLMKLAPDTACD